MKAEATQLKADLSRYLERVKGAFEVRPHSGCACRAPPAARHEFSAAANSF